MAAPSVARPGALVIHPGALGDVLLAVPALRALAGAGPVTLVAQLRLGRLLTALGIVARAEAFDTFGLDVLFTGEPVAAERPLARDFTAAARVVCWFGARDPRFVARVRALAPAAIVAPPASPPHPAWRHLAESVGCFAPDLRPVAVPADVRHRGEASLRAAGWDGISRYVVVHPGAGSASKRWPAAAFADVLEDCEATIVVHQGPADAEAVDTFLRAARRPIVRIVDPPLEALAAIMTTAAAYIGNDSGISHLAATVGAHSLVLFTPALRAWAPWSPTASCVEITAGVLVPAEQAAVRRALRAML